MMLFPFIEITNCVTIPPFKTLIEKQKNILCKSLLREKDIIETFYSLKSKITWNVWFPFHNIFINFSFFRQINDVTLIIPYL